MDLITDALQFLLDQYTGLPLWPKPPLTAIKDIKIVGHRGDIYCLPSAENTMPSFQACHQAGVWAVEFDLRWTKDDQPIILHDDCGTRIWDLPELRPLNMTLGEVRKMAPQVPTLQEVIQTLAPQTHLMIEVKEHLNRAREKTLAQMLAHLRPGENFHLLTLEPRLLENLTLFEKKNFVYVAELNYRFASDWVKAHNWGGIAGHYLLLSDQLIKQHHDLGQKVGVGYIASPNSLCREYSRQADWFFSNHAVKLQNWLKQLSAS